MHAAMSALNNFYFNFVLVPDKKKTIGENNRVSDIMAIKVKKLHIFLTTFLGDKNFHEKEKIRVIRGNGIPKKVFRRRTASPSTVPDHDVDHFRVWG